VVCWYDAVAFPIVSRVKSVVSGYVLLHLRSISDFTVKVKLLIRYAISEQRMGKKKKGFNWRAREQPGAELDTSALAAMQCILQLPPSRTTPADQGTNILGGSFTHLKREFRKIKSTGGAR